MCRHCVLKALLILCLQFSFSCSGKLPESVGPSQEILVLADLEDWKVLEQPLRDVFEKTILTPQEEKVFQIQLGSIEEFEEQKHGRRKNLVVIAPIDATHATAEFLRGLLGPQVQDRIRQGTSSVFWKEDVWARDQLLITLSGRDLSTLVDHIRQEGDRLYDSVEVARNKRISKLIYRYGERKDVTEQLKREFGWSIRVAFGYRILESKPDSGFVVLAKEEPSRWLFVFWEDGVSADQLSDDWCIRKRDEITSRFFGGDRVVPGDLEISQTDFNGKLAVSMKGLWENGRDWTGGPFHSYSFVDSDTDRFYHIDMGVFAPNKRKEPYLRQIDLMARSFSLADQPR
jgi:hypothetical protein